MNDLSGWGLYIGEVARIRIRIHWILLLFWVFELHNALQDEGESRRILLLAWILGVVITFGSILLHEFGHCFAARKVGGDADEILLWPFGGLAFCHCPDYWRAHFIVAAGGPLVTLAIVAVSYSVFWFLDGRSDFSDGPMYDMIRWYLVEWNFYILIFNLIPLYPLDGGRMFHALAWAWHQRRGGYSGWGGHGLANQITLQVSRLTAAGGALYCIYDGQQQMVLLFVWAWLMCEQALGRMSTRW